FLSLPNFFREQSFAQVLAMFLRVIPFFPSIDHYCDYSICTGNKDTCTSSFQFQKHRQIFQISTHGPPIVQRMLCILTLSHPEKSTEETLFLGFCTMQNRYHASEFSWYI